MKAVWFSRHDPTKEQIEEAQKLGYTIVAIEFGKKLGAMELQTEESVDAMMDAIRNLVVEHKAEAIFGVSSVPIQGRFCSFAKIPFFAAWNVMRSVAGEKPTFQHKKWVFVGSLMGGQIQPCCGRSPKDCDCDPKVQGKSW